jgi:hypothetical protein
LHRKGQTFTQKAVAGESLKTQRKPSWQRTLVRALLICVGAVAILLPAWLPNRPGAPIERGTVELLRAFLLAAGAAVMFGASSHAGPNRPVCRILAMGLIAAFVAEIEDFISGILGVQIPEASIVAAVLLVMVINIIRHRRAMLHFISTVGNHAGSGLIAAALLIIYLFNRVIGGAKFWQATLGPAFHPDIPRTCRTYLGLLGCYLIFIGVLGLAITLARRKEPS